MVRFRISKPDTKKLNLSVLLITLGVSLRIALAGYPNIEPVLAISLMAGLMLGGAYAFLVPFSIMALSDIAIYALRYEGMFGLKVILGISFFTWTGMMFVGYMGTRMRPRLLFRMKGIGVFTGVAVVLTVLYDLWTLVGVFLLTPWASPEMVLMSQVPFTIYHILSTLIFAPLFGVGYYYLSEFGFPKFNPSGAGTSTPDKESLGKGSVH